MDIFKVLRLLSAPWLHLAYRVIKSKKLLKMGLKADPLYLRNIKAKMEVDRRSFYVFNQLVTANLLIGTANGKADKITKSLLSKSEAQLIQDIVCLLIHNIKKEGYFVLWDGGERKPTGIECQREHVRMSGPSELRR